MFVGYAPVSTMEQNISLQIDALNQAGSEEIFQDKVSGAKVIRPGLQAALEFVQPGDTLILTCSILTHSTTSLVTDQCGT